MVAVLKGHKVVDPLCLTLIPCASRVPFQTGHSGHRTIGGERGDVRRKDGQEERLGARVQRIDQFI